MGIIQHHAIIVTVRYQSIDPMHQKAREIFGAHAQVSEVVHSPVNGYASFFVAPDGSKEHWSASDEGDERRKEFTAWLREHEDGDLAHWVEVSYGDSQYAITDSDDQDERDDDDDAGSWLYGREHHG